MPNIFILTTLFIKRKYVNDIVKLQKYFKSVLIFAYELNIDKKSDFPIFPLIMAVIILTHLCIKSLIVLYLTKKMNILKI